MDAIDRARYTKISVPFYIFLAATFAVGGYWLDEGILLAAIFGGFSYIGLQGLAFQKELIEEVGKLREDVALIKSQAGRP